MNVSSAEHYARIAPIPLITLITALLSILLTAGCATKLPQKPVATALFLPPAPPAVQTAHVPVFVVENPTAAYNRIGTPSVRKSAGDDSEEVFVDPAVATVYHETTSFTGANGTYTNEIYRIHFERVPFGWDALNLTAGTNPGLLIIYTLNDKRELVLVTTVHTCGCYLAFLPTTALPATAYPADWPAEPLQSVYGYTLPSRISLPDQNQRLVFTIADQTHRVTWVGPADQEQLSIPGSTLIPNLAPIRSLYQLPYGDTFVSFFESDGPRNGYVKDSTKPLERLLLGWLAFDFRVGEDKAYGGGDTSSIPLYTSLKFWARQDSDLKDFKGFLQYWGWQF